MMLIVVCAFVVTKGPEPIDEDPCIKGHKWRIGEYGGLECEKCNMKPGV